MQRSPSQIVEPGTGPDIPVDAVTLAIEPRPDIHPLDEPGRRQLDALKLAALSRLVGEVVNRTEPLFILDGACDQGQFSAFFASLGHRVDGIDSREAAVDGCLELPGRYFLASPDAFQSPFLYDIVYAVDVLPRIVPDEIWKACFENLATLVRVGGLLVVTDHWDDQRAEDLNAKYRSRDDYFGLAEDHGLAFRSFEPYSFRGSRLGFLVFERVR